MGRGEDREELSEAERALAPGNTSFVTRGLDPRIHVLAA
jgi:hypothetical protein